MDNFPDDLIGVIMNSTDVSTLLTSVLINKRFSERLIHVDVNRDYILFMCAADSNLGLLKFHVALQGFSHSATIGAGISCNIEIINFCKGYPNIRDFYDSLINGATMSSNYETIKVILSIIKDIGCFHGGLVNDNFFTVFLPHLDDDAVEYLNVLFGKSCSSSLVRAIAVHCRFDISRLVWHGFRRPSEEQLRILVLYAVKYKRIDSLKKIVEICGRIRLDVMPEITALEITFLKELYKCEIIDRDSYNYYLFSLGDRSTKIMNSVTNNEECLIRIVTCNALEEVELVFGISNRIVGSSVKIASCRDCRFVKAVFSNSVRHIDSWALDDDLTIEFNDEITTSDIVLIVTSNDKYDVLVTILQNNLRLTYNSSYSGRYISSISDLEMIWTLHPSLLEDNELINYCLSNVGLGTWYLLKIPNPKLLSGTFRSIFQGIHVIDEVAEHYLLNILPPSKFFIEGLMRINIYIRGRFYDVIKKYVTLKTSLITNCGRDLIAKKEPWLLELIPK